MVAEFLGYPAAFLGRLLFYAHSSGGMYALLLFCIFGFCGVLIDLDHFFSEWLSMSRPFHIPVCVFSWVVCIVYGACVFRSV